MVACGGAHFWSQDIGKLDDEVRVILPAYVKPDYGGRRTMRGRVRHEAHT